MKILKFSIIITLLLSLLACERFRPQPERVYHYVEPEENIAENIWNCLKTQHPKVKIAFEAAQNMERQGYMAEEKAARYLSKTHLDYEYHTEFGVGPWGEYDSPLYAHYQLYCYQTLNDTWIGVIIESIGGTEILKNIEENPEMDLFVVEYKNDTIIDCDISTLGPESLKVATSVSKYHYDENLVFDSVSVAFMAEKYWPMKFKWNGKAFEQDPETVFMEKAIDEYDGTFSPRDANYYYFDKDNKNLNEYLVTNGDTLAHFTYKENGRLAEYTVMSPKYGFAQTMGLLNHHRTVLSKPVAVGYPIQNVLDYEKTTHSLKDTTIVAGYKDGKYVITQQLAHDKYDRIDVFVEFTANDENADIETIRVYSEDFVVTLESELQNNKEISEKTKSIFRALNLDLDDPVLGEFNSLDGSGNGFHMSFKGTVKKMTFQTYNVDDGSTFVVLAAYFSYRDVPEIQFWNYQNGVFEEMSIDDFPTEVQELDFTNEGFTYTTPFEYNENDPLYYIYYIVTYKWNGQVFEFESKDQGSTD